MLSANSSLKRIMSWAWRVGWTHTPTRGGTALTGIDQATGVTSWAARHLVVISTSGPATSIRRASCSVRWTRMADPAGKRSRPLYGGCGPDVSRLPPPAGAGPLPRFREGETSPPLPGLGEGGGGVGRTLISRGAVQ